MPDDTTPRLPVGSAVRVRPNQKIGTIVKDDRTPTQPYKVHYGGDEDDYDWFNTQDLEVLDQPGYGLAILNVQEQLASIQRKLDRLCSHFGLD